MKNSKLKAWPNTAFGSDCWPRADSTLRLALFSVPVSSLADYWSENIPARSSLWRRSRRSAYSLGLRSEFNTDAKTLWPHQTQEASSCVSGGLSHVGKTATQKKTAWRKKMEIYSWVLSHSPFPAACKRGWTHRCSLTLTLTEKSQVRRRRPSLTPLKTMCSSWQRDSYRRDPVSMGNGEKRVQPVQPVRSFSGEDSPWGLICLTQQTYKYANCLIRLERSRTSSW